MRYRFRIDLRALKRETPPRERLELSDEPEVVGPLDETGDPRVKAYNAALNWARSQHPGRFVTGTLDYHVFNGSEGTWHVVTRPRDNRRERVSEVVVFPDGALLSRTFALQGAEPLDLGSLFHEGLDPVDLDDAALAEYPGYELQATFYRREPDRLLGIERWQRYFDAARGEIIAHESSDIPPD